MDINFLDHNQSEESVPFEENQVVLASHHAGRGESTRKRFDVRHIVRWIIYGIVAILPLLALPWTSDLLDFNKQTFLVVAVSIALVVFLIDVIQSGMVRLRMSSLYIPLGVFVLALLVSSLLSKDIFQSLIGHGGGQVTFSFLSFISLAVLFALAINVIEDGGRAFKRILASSVVAAFALAIASILGFNLLSVLGINGVTVNTIGSLNTIAVVAALFLPLFLGQSFKVYRLDVFKVYALLALFLVILVNWWLVWTITFLALISWIVFTSREKTRPSLRLYSLPLMVIVLGAFLMLIKFSFPVLKQKLIPEVTPSYTTSFKIAQAVIIESPITGYGPNNFSLAYDKYRPKSIANTIFADTRFGQSISSVITIVVEGGMIALFALIFLIGSIVRMLIRSRSSSDYLAFGSIVILGLFSSNITSLLVLFAALILLELQSSDHEERIFELEESSLYSIVGSGVFVMTLVAVLAALYFTVIRYIGDVYYVKALGRTDATQAVKYAQNAIGAVPQDSRYYRFVSQGLLVQARKEIDNKDQKISQEERTKRVATLASSAVDAAIKATAVSPSDARNWFHRGIIYQNLIGLVDGADQAAISSFGESLKRNPHDPNAHYQIGAAYFTVGENNRVVVQNVPAEQRSKLNPAQVKKLVDDTFHQAELSYKKAIELNNNFGQAVLDLGIVYERQGRVPQAIKQFEAIRNANPRDPGFAFTLGLLYYRNNQKDAAVKQWQDAVSLFPNYSNAHWYLSLSYEEQGKVDQAIAELEKIQQFNPDSKEVTQRLETLRSGKRVIPPGKVLNQKPL